METNLQESSVDFFKLRNGIFIIKWSITLCKVPCKNLMWFITVSFPRHFHLSDIRQAEGIKDTPLTPSNIWKERCPGYEVNFITKYKLRYWKLSIIKNHVLTWKPKYFQVKETLKSNEYWIQKLLRSNVYNKNWFLRQY